MTNIIFNENELETIYNLAMFYIISVNEGHPHKGLNYEEVLKIQLKFVEDKE